MKGIATFLLLMSSFTAFPESTKPPQTVDRIFVNGDVLPGAILLISKDGSNSVVRGMFLQRAQAIAVSGDRIVAVGTNEDIQKLKGKHTEVVDLGGHFVMPGFNDAHMHLAAGGMEKLNVDLVGVKSLAEMQQRIAERAKTTPAGEWIRAKAGITPCGPSRSCRHDRTSMRLPAIILRFSVASMDTSPWRTAPRCRKLASQKHVPIRRVDRSIAMRVANRPAFCARRPGVLSIQVIPPPTPAKRREAIQLALADAARYGLTSIQDYSQWEDFLVYEDLEREGKLTVRISEWLPFTDPVAVLQEHRAHHPQTDTMLRTGMLKGFMDGSLGSRTAALLAPYSDDPRNSGLPQFEQAQLNQMTRERVAAGFQIGFHAIGDRACEMALQAFAAAAAEIREKELRAASSPAQVDDFRFRIEHAQVVAPDQFARFHQLGVIASMQPNHLLTDMNWAESRIGPERAKTSYAWQQFLTDEVRVPFGTDYPVEPLTPFRGLYAAVTRKNEAGTKSYFPEQKVTIEEAIGLIQTTRHSPSSRSATRAGSSPGLLADFVVLDRDITKVPAHEILGDQGAAHGGWRQDGVPSTVTCACGDGNFPIRAVLFKGYPLPPVPHSKGLRGMG